MFDESFAQAWRLRYGGEPFGEVPGLARFLSHRSVREFSSEPVSEATVAALVACAQSAATSSNLQLWSIVSVQDREHRDKLATLCANQQQIREAAWFFAFCADHHRLARAARALGEDPQALQYMEFYTMAAIDASLAAERMTCAAEAIGLGICYIGALRNDPKGVAEALGLPDGVFGLFGYCLGHPRADAKADVKPRLPQEAIWFREQYGPDAGLSEYDGRMRPFYLSVGGDPAVTWTQRSARRVTLPHLGGRATQRQFLESHGFGLK